VQPNILMVFVGDISWHLAQIEGGVPHALVYLVVRVRQRFLTLLIQSKSCTQATKHPGRYANVQVETLIESIETMLFVYDSMRPTLTTVKGNESRRFVMQINRSRSKNPLQ